MSEAMLIEEIRLLPADLKARVADFVTALKKDQKPVNKLKEREFGGLKGAFVMSPNFDEPMEEFKDYM